MKFIQFIHKRLTLLTQTQLFFITSLLFFSNNLFAAGTISGDVVTDNYYQIYSGDINGGGLVEHTTGSVAGPGAATNYNFFSPNDYLYVVAWSDDGVQQFFAGDLTLNGSNISTSSGLWDVAATGIDFDNAAGPALATVVTEIQNANTGTTWTAPASTPIGTLVNTGGLASNGLWFDSGTGVGVCNPAITAGAPFCPGFNHSEFLIFRIDIRQQQQEPLDHFNRYPILQGVPPTAPVNLVDQFGSFNTILGLPSHFFVPALKNNEPGFDPLSHLTCYPVEEFPADLIPPDVMVTNQFGNSVLDLHSQAELCVPTQKLIDPPGEVTIDHFLCYSATGQPLNTTVLLQDQFGSQDAIVLDPVTFCNPVDKNGEGVVNPVDHLTCYNYQSQSPTIGQVPISNQFVQDSGITIERPDALCVPSLKEPLGPEPVDHFTLYQAIGPQGFPVVVDDQFGQRTVDSGRVNLFMAPANKNQEGVFDPISHLTCHEVLNPEEAPPHVVINNQFGEQNLELGISTELCLPTEKPELSPGLVNIDHFHCYEATGAPLNTDIFWSDQFFSFTNQLIEPMMLCNPAEKNGEGILNNDDHLVCYKIVDDPTVVVGSITINNQFSSATGATNIEVFSPVGFCAPSSKKVVDEVSVPMNNLFILAVLASLLTLAGTLLRKNIS